MSEPEAHPLLILDLDETLIHATTRRCGRDPDFRAGPYAIYKRPGLADFLGRISLHYEIAIWSASSADYVDLIIGKIIPENIALCFQWSRSRCTWSYDAEYQTQFLLKDLKKVKRTGYDLKRTLIVDDESRKLRRSYGNAIYIPPFEGDPGDRELPLLGEYLPSIAAVADFRRLEKRNWRSRAAGMSPRRNA